MAMTFALLGKALAILAPLAGACWARWSPNRSGILDRRGLFLPLIVAAGALAAGGEMSAHASAQGFGIDPAAMLLAAIALANAVAVVVVPVRTTSERRAMAWLLGAQSMLAVFAFIDDLRLMAAALGIWSSCVTAATCLADEDGTGSAGHAIGRAKRLLWMHAPGLTLVFTGIGVAAFADAAIAARVTHHPAAWRFGGLAVFDNLAELPPGGSAGEIWRQLRPWCVFPLAAGLALVCGIVPFHRPAAAVIRAASPSVRTPLCLIMIGGGWIAAWRLLAPVLSPLVIEAPHLLMPLPLMTLWLSAALILSRGDTARLTAAIMLFATGQAATAMVVPMARIAPGLFVIGLALPLAAVATLLARLESRSGTREFSEFRGLARTMPAFASLLALAVFWLYGMPGLSVFPALWTGWQERQLSAAFRQFEGISLWPLLVPQVIALWGWVRLLDSLLRGAPRFPRMPDALADRVELRQFGTVLPEDLNRRDQWLFGGLIAAGLALGLLPQFSLRHDVAVTAEMIRPEEDHVAPEIPDATIE